MFSMSSGPWMPSGKPGKFSTSVVVMSAPPASRNACEDQGLETCPGRVDGSGVTGGAGADDDNVANLSHGKLSIER